MSTSTLAETTFRGRLAHRILLILLPLILLPVVIMGYIAYRHAQTLLQAQATHQIQSAVRASLKDLDEWLTIKEIRLDRVLRQATTREALQQCRNRADAGFADPQYVAARSQLLAAFEGLNTTETYPLFNDFFVLDLQGRVLVSSRANAQGEQLQSAPWWPEVQAALQDHPAPVHLASAHLMPLLPEGTFGVLSVVRGPTPETRDLLIVGLSRGIAVERFLQAPTTALPASTSYFLTAQGEWVRVDPLEQKLTVSPLPTAIQQHLRAIFARPSVEQDLALEYTLPQGKTTLLAVVGWLPRLKAGLGVEVPKHLMLANIQSLLPFTAVLLLLTALFLALIIWLITQSITRPIQTLAQVTRNFASGDLRARAPVKRRDELGMLAYTFNQMANELSDLYHSLEQQVNERTQQIQAAAEVASLATSATSLDEILRRTVALIVERFPQYYHASIFLLDDERRFAVLRESIGPAGEEMKRRGHRLAVDGTSLVGWAALHNQPRVASDVAEDPIHFKNPLLPETRSEAAIPIAVGPQVLGVLDVQSKDPYAFDEHAVATLQTLARQLATALYNARLLEATRINLEEAQTLYQVSRAIAQAETVPEVLDSLQEALQASPFAAALLYRDAQEERFRPLLVRTAQGETHENLGTVPVPAIQALFPGRAPLFVSELQFDTLPDPLTEVVRLLRSPHAALIPLYRNETVVGVAILGAETYLDPQRIQSYIHLVEVASNAITKIYALENAQLRLTELDALNRLSQALAAAANLEDLYQILAQEIRHLFGDVTFAVAWYNAARQQISLPYVLEQGQFSPKSFPEPFDLGEGIISWVIHHQEPLLINHPDEMAAYNPRHIGRPAKSWMGAPLIVGDEILGALLLQDLEQEGRFSEDDFRLFVTIATQVALAVRNLHLLEISQRQAEQQRLLLQTGERLRRTTDLRVILETVTHEMRRVLNAQRALMHLHRLPSTAQEPSEFEE